MNRLLLVFPHQLFQSHPGLQSDPDLVLLIEDSLFFGDDRYPLQFHKQKLWLHRASMKRYQAWLEDQDFQNGYAEYDPGSGSLLGIIESAIDKLSSDVQIETIEPDDFILEKRIRRICKRLELQVRFLPNPGFINSPDDNQEYRSGKKRWFQADFYKWQRKRLDILIESGEPVGGKWSFDAENRKKVPKKLLGELPRLPQLKIDDFDEEARQYIERRFPDHPGSLDTLYYPTSHTVASNWLDHFLTSRFENFGVYEDAIVSGESWLWHSVLTPMLNIGLLTPTQVVGKALDFASQNDVPLNSLEGFIRQIIGWREFIRATYQDLGVEMRNGNHWNHTRPMPDGFYTATTGIEPVDDAIRRLLETGYCHHIERLMVLGGFMFLCEIEPRSIYLWFMELFVDSYDWVMVPNVYAMSQHADGGLITTKPYFSGSSYIRKMGNHPKGDWCEVWDGLYWRWIWNHKDELSKNPRWAMMCSMADRMDKEKMKTHLKNAKVFLKKLG